MTVLSRALLGAAAAVLLVAGAANATPFTKGSFSLGVFTSTTSKVTTTMMFTTTSNYAAGSGTGSFMGVSFPTLTPPGTLDFGTASTFNFSDAALGTFTATSTKLLNTVGGNNASATWYVKGTFAPGTDWTGPSSLSADETWTLNQTGGAGNSISMSATFDSPAIPPSVPEPATLALLASALIGVGAVRRKKKSS